MKISLDKLIGQTESIELITLLNTIPNKYNMSFGSGGAIINIDNPVSSELLAKIVVVCSGSVEGISKSERQTSITLTPKE